jgi:hypothetical protein
LHLIGIKFSTLLFNNDIYTCDNHFSQKFTLLTFIVESFADDVEKVSALVAGRPRILLKVNDFLQIPGECGVVDRREELLLLRWLV